MNRQTRLTLLTIVAVLGLLAGSYASHDAFRTRINAQLGQLAFPTGERSSEEIARLASRATVKIDGLDFDGRVLGTGSGFFTSKDGVIATNIHVVRKAASLRVTTSDGDIYEQVYMLSSDPLRDLATLKIGIDDASFLELSRDTLPALGTKVYVMGNPLGQSNTFSDGIVSATRRLEGATLLQITAPISPGSSGGPLLNTSGQVVGIATLTLEGGQNLNYAVPVRYLRPLATASATPAAFDAQRLASGRPAWRTEESEYAQTEPNPSVPSTRTAAPVRYIVRAMQQSARNAAVDGFQTIGAPIFDWLSEDEWITYPLSNLVEGKEYLLKARCNEDCTDIDLFLQDAQGNTLRSDTEEDDFPVIAFTTVDYPTASQVKLKMYKCGAERCEAGIRLFGLNPR